jgi:glycosyltransferase involved in cell wall biosynthesis
MPDHFRFLTMPERDKKLMTIVATTTWNSSDLIETFLQHYRKLGFDQVLVMDFDSTDGTSEILRSSRYHGFVRTIPFPRIVELDSSRILLNQAKRDFGPDTGCLFCDPDELLVLPGGAAVSDLGIPAMSAAILPRFNMTGRLSSARDSAEDLSPLGVLNLRIQKPSRRKPSEDMHKDVLSPPWIYTAIPGKVFVRLGPTLAVGDGDHSAIVSDKRVAPAPAGAYLLHFPFRTYEAFEEKMRLAASDFASNPHSAETYGWQIRRWLRIAKSGNLHDEYLQQFVPDEQVDQSIEDGTLALDDSVRALHMETQELETTLRERERDRISLQSSR